MSIFNFIRKVSDYLSDFLRHIAMWGVFVMMLLVVIDVALRALAKRSTLVAEEVGGYLMVLIAYLAMAEAFKQGRHIRVDVVSKRLKGGLQAWTEIVLSSIALVALVVVIWRVIIMVYYSYVGNAITPGLLMTPVYIPQTLIIIGLSALALQCILDLSKTLNSLLQTSKRSRR